MPYYTPTGNPQYLNRGISLTMRNEFILIQGAFGQVLTDISLRGLIAGQTWTGVHDFTGATITVQTQAPGDNSNKAASTAHVFAADSLKADITSPYFLGIPTADTAPPGTSTMRLATTEFVANTAFSSTLPAQSGNAGKVLSTDGTNATWIDADPAALAIVFGG